LQDQNIKTAYDSAQQFDGWTPHLTLGYPDTPANPIADDQISSFYDVSFNKIAVWTGDFNGPEFLLKDYWDEIDEMDIPMDVAMSSLGKERVQLGLTNLDHSGVKGMKWGVRKDTTVTVGGKTKQVTAKKGAKLDKAWEKKIYSMPGAIAVHNAMAEHFNQRIGALNDKYKDNDFSGTKWENSSTWTPREHQYMKEVNALTEKGNREAVKQVHGSSPTGKRHAELSPDGESIIVKETAVKHAADNSDVVAVLRIARNNNGLVINATPKTAIHGEAFVDSLIHFGIKGMKWGVRKPPPSATAATATSRVPHGEKRKTKIDTTGGENHPAHEDAIKVAEARIKLKRSGAAALSNQELRDVANRLQLEGQVAVLTSHKGKRFVTQQLQNEGQNLARQGVKKGVKKGAMKIGAVALV
jgi:hypothetical protein